MTCADLTRRDAGGRRKTVLSALETARALPRPRGFESRILRPGSPTELPVLYRQNSGGGLFLVLRGGLTVALVSVWPGQGCAVVVLAGLGEAFVGGVFDQAVEAFEGVAQGGVRPVPGR